MTTHPNDEVVAALEQIAKGDPMAYGDAVAIAKQALGWPLTVDERRALERIKR